MTISDQYQSSLTISGVISGTGPLQTYGPGLLAISGVSTYGGATLVHSGPVVVTATGSIPATTDLTVGDATGSAAVGTTASVLFNASTGTTIRPVTLASLSLASNGSVTLTRSTAIASRSVMVVGALNFNSSAGAWGGLLDLGNNDLIVHNGNLASLQSQLAQGYNKGAALWQGSGGITSATAASDATKLTTLGVTQNSDNQTTGSPAIYSMFDG